MNKVFRYLMMTVLAACFCTATFSSAEAASVALIPLINHVEGDELAGQVFYKSAIAALNAKKGFVMVDNDTLTSVIEANTTKGVLPTEGQLAKIAKEANVDIVIAVELDECDDIGIAQSEEDKLKMNIKGHSLAYNSLTGKPVKYRIYDDEVLPDVLSSRWDLVHERWGLQVKYAINRSLSEK